MLHERLLLSRHLSQVLVKLLLDGAAPELHIHVRNLAGKLHRGNHHVHRFLRVADAKENLAEQNQRAGRQAVQVLGVSHLQRLTQEALRLVEAAFVERVQSLHPVVAPEQRLVAEVRRVLSRDVVQQVPQLLVLSGSQVNHRKVQIAEELQLPMVRLLHGRHELHLGAVVDVAGHRVQSQQAVELGGVRLEQRLVGRRQANVLRQRDLFDGPRTVAHDEPAHGDVFQQDHLEGREDRLVLLRLQLLDLRQRLLRVLLSLLEESADHRLRHRQDVHKHEELLLGQPHEVLGRLLAEYLLVRRPVGADNRLDDALQLLQDFLHRLHVPQLERVGHLQDEMEHARIFLQVRVWDGLEADSRLVQQCDDVVGLALDDEDHGAVQEKLRLQVAGIAFLSRLDADRQKFRSEAVLLVVRVNLLKEKK